MLLTGAGVVALRDGLTSFEINKISKGYGGGLL
jgi:hypothetical protein